LYFCTCKASKVPELASRFSRCAWRCCSRCSYRAVASLACRWRLTSVAFAVCSSHVSIRRDASAYVSIRQHMSAYVCIRQHTSACVSTRQHTSHTSAYVSMRQHTSACVAFAVCSSLVTSFTSFHTHAHTHARTHAHTDPHLQIARHSLHLFAEQVVFVLSTFCCGCLKRRLFRCRLQRYAQIGALCPQVLRSIRQHSSADVSDRNTLYSSSDPPPSV
jgi:hypothetical protein